MRYRYTAAFSSKGHSPARQSPCARLALWTEPSRAELLTVWMIAERGVAHAYYGLPACALYRGAVSCGHARPQLIRGTGGAAERRLCPQNVRHHSYRVRGLMWALRLASAQQPRQTLSRQQVTQLLLADLDLESVQAAIQRFFDASKVLEDGAFHNFVSALCKLNVEMIRMQGGFGTFLPLRGPWGLTSIFRARAQARRALLRLPLTSSPDEG